MKLVLVYLMLAMSPVFMHTAMAQEAEYVFDRAVFDVVLGEISAPLSTHKGGELGQLPDGSFPGWVQTGPGGYVSFNSDDVFFPDEGTVEIKLVVLDPAGLARIGNDQQALVSLYDNEGVPFFSVGINDHDVAVGSYELHPMLMEDVFGGVGFPYVSKLDGPLKPGADLTITVTWGLDPSENAVYLNGSYIDIEHRKGPRNQGGPPGVDPVKTLGSFMHGFEVFDGRVVGPPKTFVIGKIGDKDPGDPVSMYPPVSVAITRVWVWNVSSRRPVHS